MLRYFFRRFAVTANSSLRVKHRLWRWWYRYFDRILDEQPVWFLNYGLVLPNGEKLTLRAGDEEHRASVQLYHRVADTIKLRDLVVLEVSCGRGGGVLYLKEYLGPRLVVGLDQTEAALAFCYRRRSDRVASLVCGDALALPFSDASFDAIVNVEASHCYPCLERFLSEAKRVLRSDGYMLYADMRKKSHCGAWRTSLVDSGFHICEEEDITEHVARALTATHEQKESLIQRITPRFPRRLVRLFAGAKGTGMYRRLQSGDVRYIRFVLRKEP